jgi:hypothetical protein
MSRGNRRFLLTVLLHRNWGVTTILDKDNKSVPNPEYTSWKQMDQLVLSLIYSSLTEEAMCEVLGLTSSREAWLALEESFSDKSKTCEIQLKDDLQMMKKGSRTVGEYGRDFKNICDQLTTMGRLVDDTDKVHWFLRRLGAAFASFSTTMLS